MCKAGPNPATVWQAIRVRTQMLAIEVCVVSTSSHGGVSSLRVIGFKDFQGTFEKQVFAQNFIVSGCAGSAEAFVVCSFKDVALKNCKF